MLTKLKIKNFKLFEDVEIELGNPVVFVGPNNSGKTAALQCLALWHLGVRRWCEKRGSGPVSETRKRRPYGVTISRRDLIAVPVPSADMFWRDLRVRAAPREGEKTQAVNVHIEVLVEGAGVAENGGGEQTWACGMEFYYANEESFYCRPLACEDGKYMPVPKGAAGEKIVYLPPMSGLAANEVRLEPGAIDVRLGEGRTAEVLRNICHQVSGGSGKENDGDNWKAIVFQMKELFGCEMNEPQYIAERGEIVMTYNAKKNVKLDISASGRGQQQVLLLLAHMAANPGAIILLDEPDAHLEILRQRQTYDLLCETAKERGSQIVMASHSEVIMNEAAQSASLVAFVGKPHRIDGGKVSQVRKALAQIGFEHYLLAEQKGWVLYLEGSSDLGALKKFAAKLGHHAGAFLGNPFVIYVGNQPKKAYQHLYGLREAKPDLRGVALYDRLGSVPEEKPGLQTLTWAKREIENYFCQKQAFLNLAHKMGETVGPLFGPEYRQAMENAIQEVERAWSVLGKEEIWGPDIKASDDCMASVFGKFFSDIGQPNMMIAKGRYSDLIDYLEPESIDPEVSEKLNAIAEVAERAMPTGP